MSDKDGGSGASSGRMNPSALTVEEAAALLKIEAETVRRHIDAGLPTDGRGRIHLVEYVAWLNLRLAELSPAAGGAG